MDSPKDHELIEATHKAMIDLARPDRLQADTIDLMTITNLDDLRYLVRRFEHETGVRVGAHETIEECTRALVGALMSIKATQKRRRQP